MSRFTIYVAFFFLRWRSSKAHQLKEPFFWEIWWILFLTVTWADWYQIHVCIWSTEQEYQYKKYIYNLSKAGVLPCCILFVWSINKEKCENVSLCFLGSYMIKLWLSWQQLSTTTFWSRQSDIWWYWFGSTEQRPVTTVPINVASYSTAGKTAQKCWVDRCTANKKCYIPFYQGFLLIFTK